MPIIQLYNADWRGVVSTRICPLYDATEATVRRETNGEYSLTATLPRGAVFENEVQLGRAVKAVVNEAGKEQYFIIKRRRRSLAGGMSIYAEHQSYLYNGVVCRGTASGYRTPSMALYQAWFGAHPSITDIGSRAFSRSDNSPKQTPAVTSPTSLRSLLLGWLIETYGGEMVFDGFDVDWVDAMGSDNGAEYRYGLNLTEMETEDILDEYASGIFPYWGSVDPKTNVGIVTINDFVLPFSGTWPMQNIIPLDLTDRFENEPTPAELLEAAQEYAAVNTPTGIPISIRASRARIIGDVPVDLGDTVTVTNTPWGMSQKTRIFALNFDALRGRVKDAEFGTVNPGFAGAVRNMK